MVLGVLQMVVFLCFVVFGADVAISGNQIIVGAFRGIDSQGAISGSAYFYSLGGEEFSFTACCRNNFSNIVK